MKMVEGCRLPILEYDDIKNVEHLTTGSHYTKGRKGRYENEVVPIQYLFLHNTEGRNSLYWLTRSSQTQASAHCLGYRNGMRYNLVRYADTAHHAGWCKPGYGNKNSLGYELENWSNAWGRKESYPEIQVNVAAQTFAGWVYSYGLGTYSIVRHGDVAVWPPGETPTPYYPRRADPSNFNFPAFIEKVDIYAVFFNSLPDEEVTKYLL